jgi:hypothetical protein
MPFAMPIWKALLWNAAQRAAQHPRVQAAAIDLARRAVPHIARAGQSAIETVRRAPLPSAKDVAAAVRETVKDAIRRKP